jgi:ferritin-like metal-binding protein YciE
MGFADDRFGLTVTTTGYRCFSGKELQMFERLNTPEEAYNHKLGAALRMERAILEILEVNVKNAEDALIMELLGAHLEESRSHAPALESAFSLFGWAIDDSSCPVIEAFEKEGEALIKKAEATIVDGIILQNAAEVENYEIGVYANLIVSARALNRHDVAELLHRNLESERVALGKLMTLQTELGPVRGTGSL